MGKSSLVADLVLLALSDLLDPDLTRPILCRRAAYFAYKISRIYNDTSSDRYSAARATLTIFSVLCLVMLLATFILMGLCMLNFGKGLKERSESLYLSLAFPRHRCGVGTSLSICH